MSPARKRDSGCRSVKAGWRPPERNELLMGLVLGRATSLLESRGEPARYTETFARFRERLRRVKDFAQDASSVDYEAYCSAMARATDASRAGKREEALTEARNASRHAEALDPAVLGEALVSDCRAESAAALARTECEAGQVDRAAQRVKEALALAESGSGDPAVLALLRLTEACLSRAEGELWEAVVAFSHAFAYSAVLGHQADQAEALLGQAQVLADLGQRLHAEEAAALALLALEPHQEPRLELSALRLLAELEEIP